jgi:precorrin-2 methylase
LDKSDCTVVIYKGGRHFPVVAGRLAERDRLRGAVVGELLGLPGARSGPLTEVDNRPASYLATMVIPPAGRQDHLARQ